MNVRRAKIVVMILASFAIAIGICVGLMYGVYHEVPVSASSFGELEPTSTEPEGEFPENRSTSTSSPNHRQVTSGTVFSNQFSTSLTAAAAARSTVSTFQIGNGRPYTNLAGNNMIYLQTSDYDLTNE
jgi:hypothetical protein